MFELIWSVFPDCENVRGVVLFLVNFLGFQVLLKFSDDLPYGPFLFFFSCVSLSYPLLLAFLSLSFPFVSIVVPKFFFMFFLRFSLRSLFCFILVKALL